MFAKYGFEVPDFECEILKELKNGYIGMVTDEGKILACVWDKDGIQKSSTGALFETCSFKLTPIKKPWHEEEINFPTFAWVKKKNEDEKFIVYLKGFEDNQFIEYGVNPNSWKYTLDKWEVTKIGKEEVLSLFKGTK